MARIAAPVVAPENPRLRILRPGPPREGGRCVICWVQRAQRGRDNLAVDRAIEWGNGLRLPVLAVFGLTADYPSAHRRHYRFLVDGLPDIRDELAARNVPFLVRLGEPDEVVRRAAREFSASIIVGDENPLRVGQRWRDRLADAVEIPFECMDADVVVPSSLLPKEEYAARTIRPKIHRLRDEYLSPSANPAALVGWPDDLPLVGEPVEAEALMASLKVGGVAEVPGYRGGSREARSRLDEFLGTRLARYDTERNEPTPYMTSELSAHLHFGHIGPIEIALAVKDADAPEACRTAYLEELIVRRELSINFVARNPLYDTLRGCPSWALATLAKHASDPRPIVYSAREMEAGETHDPLWNASQWEMVLTGRMHNYLRMYWAKKILEWSPDPETAFDVALELNDRYEMDGRDPNGYTGVAWAIGGKHDRPWAERPIFGMVRFMSYESTRKKFGSADYIRRVERMRRTGKIEG